jgi:hypothetical protein
MEAPSGAVQVSDFRQSEMRYRLSNYPPEVHQRAADHHPATSMQYEFDLFHDQDLRFPELHQRRHVATIDNAENSMHCTTEIVSNPLARHK